MIINHNRSHVERTVPEPSRLTENVAIMQLLRASEPRTKREERALNVLSTLSGSAASIGYIQTIRATPVIDSPGAYGHWQNTWVKIRMIRQKSHQGEQQQDHNDRSNKIIVGTAEI